MLKGLVEQAVTCPYCWERTSILVDSSELRQELIEDCEVCCRPIQYSIAVDGERVAVDARREDD